MKDELLEVLVKQAFTEGEKSISFLFQGGEPTLTGLDFYKRFIALLKEYNVRNLKIHKAIQTNGMLIDEEWAEFFAKNEFLVGLSLDGDSTIHDTNRIDAEGNGSFNRVMKTARLFEKYNVSYNILCVVTKNVAKHIRKIYGFYKKHGFRFLQFIPCLDPLGDTRGKEGYSLTPQDYVHFLTNLFDMWYDDLKKGEYVSIRQFDNYINMLRGYPAESCGMNGVCGSYFTIEADGSVYPCDFYVLDKWDMGKIGVNTFDEMRKTEVAKEFIDQSRSVADRCLSCKFYTICRGGCKRDRESGDNGQISLNYFCESYKSFFEHSLDRMIEIAMQYHH